MLFGLGFVAISLLHKGVPREVFLANQLASNDNLTSKNQETKHIQMQTNVNRKSGPNKKTKYTLEKPMLTEKTELALVAFYDIQLGHGAGLFFQLQSPHRAKHGLSIAAQLCWENTS